MSYLDFQLLLYVSPEQYEPCRTFYEQVFATQPFYGWDEGPEDRGVKYDLAGTKLVLLTQENPFPTSGAVHFQLQVPTLEDIYSRAQAVPSPRSRSTAPTAGICSAWRIRREITSIFIPCQPPPNKAHRNRKKLRGAAYETEAFRKLPPFFRF